MGKRKMNSVDPEERRYRGVRRRKWGRYCAEIRDPFQKKQVWLGTFDTAELAAQAWDNASRSFYGDEAVLNLPLPTEAGGGESNSNSSAVVNEIENHIDDGGMMPRRGLDIDLNLPPPEEL